MQVSCFVVLPQAFRAMALVMLTQSIVMLQDTPLGCVIALRDFMTMARVVANRDGRVIELYCFAAVACLAICLAASRALRASRRPAVA